MRRFNNAAFDRSLRLEGEEYSFYKYNRTGTIEYDATTQLPTNLGSIVTHYADALDFTKFEIQNMGGLVDFDSKKFVVLLDTDLEKDDEVLDSNDLEIYKIVDVRIFANRKHLISNKVKDKPTQH